MHLIMRDEVLSNHDHDLLAHQFVFCILIHHKYFITLKKYLQIDMKPCEHVKSILPLISLSIKWDIQWIQKHLPGNQE